MVPEGLVAACKCIAIAPAVWSAIVPVLVTIHHINGAMVLRVSTRTLDAVAKAAALDVTPKVRRWCVPSAGSLPWTIPWALPVSLPVARRRWALCQQRRRGDKQPRGNNSSSNAVIDLHGGTPFFHTGKNTFLEGRLCCRVAYCPNITGPHDIFRNSTTEHSSARAPCHAHHTLQTFALTMGAVFAH